MMNPLDKTAARTGEPVTQALSNDEVYRHRGVWGDFFRNRVGSTYDGRIVFEVGCFDAGFLCTIAAKHPTTAFIGIDWKVKSLAAGAERVAAMGLQNVILLRGRAQDLRKIFAEGEVDEMWVFHPEPCDEPNQLKNRLIAEPFLSDVHAVLRDGGSLAIKTDHPGYYQWVLGLLGLPEPAWFADVRLGKRVAGTPRVRGRDLMRPTDLPGRSDAVLRQFGVAVYSADFWNDAEALHRVHKRMFAGEKTLFEMKFVQKRQPIYYVELQKK